MTPRTTAFRVFPWDAAADDGQPFSPAYTPPNLGRGRFDRPGTTPPTLYVAETPEHAVAEQLQAFRGRRLRPGQLKRSGHPLAISAVAFVGAVWDGLADLCDPSTLLDLGTRPDLTASADRRTTQAIAARAATLNHSGVRWWSFYSGDWHTIALFSELLTTPPVYGTPEPLTPAHPAVIAAADSLGISL